MPCACWAALYCHFARGPRQSEIGWEHSSKRGVATGIFPANNNLGPLCFISDLPNGLTDSSRKSAFARIGSPPQQARQILAMPPDRGP